MGEVLSKVATLITPLYEATERAKQQILFYEYITKDIETAAYTQEDRDFYIDMKIYCEIRYKRSKLYFYAMADAKLEFDEGTTELILTNKLMTFEQIRCIYAYTDMQKEAEYLLDIE